MVELTDIGGEGFEQRWPLAAASVDRLLRGHHVSAPDRDDIIQEVAARAFIRQDEFTSLNHLTRWSCRVAANLRVDQLRRNRRLSDADVPEQSTSVDTAQLVEGRVALEAVLSAVSRLSDADRVALFGEREDAEDRRGAVRLAVRRHRARARLAAMVEGMIAAFAVFNRTVLRRSETVGIREAVAISSVAVVTAAIPVMGAFRVEPEPTELRQPSAPASVVFERGPDGADATPDAADVSVGRLQEAREHPAPPAVADPRATRRVVDARPDGGAGASVDEVEPEEPKTLCLQGFTPDGREHCVDRPGPAVPIPTLVPE